MSGTKERERQTKNERLTGPLTRPEGTIENLKFWFGESWRWSEMAEWIMARSKSSERIPEFAKLWAWDFLRTRKEQERRWKDSEDERPTPAHGPKERVRQTKKKAV